jgi:hypothetical protein
MDEFEKLEFSILDEVCHSSITNLLETQNKTCYPSNKRKNPGVNP